MVHRLVPGLSKVVEPRFLPEFCGSANVKRADVCTAAFMRTHTASDPAKVAILRSSPFLIFSILGAIAVAVWWTCLVSLFTLALHDEQYTHILLIFPISAVLIFLDWEPAEPSSGWRLPAGGSLLILAVIITAAIHLRSFALSPEVELSANMLAFVVWCVGAFVASFGASAFRRALFPLCFLLWLVPFPPFVLNRIVSLLQQGSTAAAHLLFLIAGIPVAQRDTFLHIPGLTLEVAPECSSMRSSMMLIVTTMVLAQLLLRSYWRKLVVVAAAIPLSIAKNGLRIFVLGVLATRVDPSFLTGRLHRQGGIIFFLIAMAGIVSLLWILRRGEENSSKIVNGNAGKISEPGTAKF